MSFAPVLSKKEKTLAVVAGALLVVFVVVGYAKAQDAPPPAPEPTTTVEDTANQSRNIKDRESYAKNIRREIDDIKRAVKQGLDTSVSEKYLAEFEACIAGLQSSVGTNDFWNKNTECDEHSRGFEDDLRDNLRPKRQCSDFMSTVKNRRDERKRNLETQLKDIKRNDKTADTSALEAKLVEIDGLITKLETAVATCTVDTTADAQGIQSDIDYAFRDFYDLSNEVSQKANNSRQTVENQRDFDKNLKRQCEKDYARELKNLEKEVARTQKIAPLPENAQVAYDKVKQLYNDACVTQIAAMQQALTAGDMDAFNDARNVFNEYNRDFWDLLNEARTFINQQQQMKDVLREISQREKDLSQMKKEYERAVKQSGGTEIAQAKQILADLEALFIKAKEAAQTDPQSWWQDYQREMSDLQNDFWNSFQKVQQVAENQRWLKDISREITDRERNLKNMRRDKGLDPKVISSLEGILSRMKDAVTKAQELIASGDPDAARETLQSMDDLRFEWDETSRSLWEEKQMVFELDQMKREIEYALKMVSEMVQSGKLGKEEAEVCRNFIESVKAKIPELSGSQNPEEFFEDLEDEANAACPFLEEGGPPPPDHEYYREFIKENVSDVDEDIGASVLQKVSEDVAAKVIQRLLSDPTAMQNLLNAAGSRYQSSVAGTLEAATNFYDESGQRDLISKKAEILELNKQLEQLKTQVQIAQDKLKELTAIQDEIASYNFYGSAGDDIRNEVEQFIAEAQERGLSKDQIRLKIGALKIKKDEAIAKSRDEKVKAQIIPFHDTDDNVWYTKYVAPLAKLGIVRGKGDGRNFDPGGNVTVAEILTMAFRVSGDEEISGNSELCSGKFQGHWANKFVGWAESKGLSIVSQCTDINRPALRWEVAQVLLETANGEVGRSDDTCFVDVKSSDQPTNSVVCGARKTGILKGTDGRANAYNKIIRAEAATMVKQAAEALFGFDFGGDENAEREKRGSGEEEMYSEEEYGGEEETGDNTGFFE